MEVLGRGHGDLLLSQRGDGRPQGQRRPAKFTAQARVSKPKAVEGHSTPFPHVMDTLARRRTTSYGDDPPEPIRRSLPSPLPMTGMTGQPCRGRDGLADSRRIDGTLRRILRLHTRPSPPSSPLSPP